MSILFEITDGAPRLREKSRNLCAGMKHAHRQNREPSLKTMETERGARLITDARFSVGSPTWLHWHTLDPGPPTRIRHTGLRAKVQCTPIYFYICSYVTTNEWIRPTIRAAL